MARKKNPISTGQAVLLGGAAVAAAAGTAYWVGQPKKGEYAPTGNVPPSTEPLILPGPPAAPDATPGGVHGLGGSDSPSPPVLTQGVRYREQPATFVMSVYTVRWVPERGEWGQWSGPMSFRGHVVDKTWTGKPIYSSPEDDLVEYLDALGLTNQAPGFWIGYAVPIVQEDAQGVPTQYGRQGPWVSGRFGDLHDLNSDPALRFFHQYFATDAIVTEYDWIDAGVVGGQKGLMVPVEKKLA